MSRVGVSWLDGCALGFGLAGAGLLIITKAGIAVRAIAKWLLFGVAAAAKPEVSVLCIFERKIVLVDNFYISRYLEGTVLVNFNGVMAHLTPCG